MTPRLALQPTPGDSMDEGGNEFDPSLNERDRDLDVAHLSRLKDEHKAARCELDEAQFQLQRGHHRFANSSHAMNTLHELAKVLERQQHLLSNFAILTLPYEHDGDDDPAYTALKTGRTLRNGLSDMSATAIGDLGSHLDRVTSCVNAVNAELPALEKRERDSRQHEATTDRLYREHLLLMHESERPHGRCDALLSDVVDLSPAALSSDGQDSNSPQVPAEDVFVPQATPPTHIQALAENISTETAPSRPSNSSSSHSLEEEELQGHELYALSAHTACTQEQEDGEYLDDYIFPEPSDAIRPAHLIGGDSNQELRGPGTGGTGHPKPRKPYQPPRPDTVSIINKTLEEMRTGWPMNPTISELCSLQLRIATPDDLPDTLRSEIGARLQQPDDFIALAAAPEIPDLFAKQADIIDYKSVRKTVFVAVLVHALRIARMHPDPTAGTSTDLATRVVEIFNEYGIDAEFWRSYHNMVLAVSVAFARAGAYHLIPEPVQEILSSLVAGQAVRPNYLSTGIDAEPEIVDWRAEYRDEKTPFVAWPVPTSCKCCNPTGRSRKHQLRVCYATAQQNGKHCAACVVQHNSMCPKPPRNASLKRSNDGPMGEEPPNKKQELINRMENR